MDDLPASLRDYLPRLSEPPSPASWRPHRDLAPDNLRFLEEAGPDGLRDLLRRIAEVLLKRLRVGLDVDVGYGLPDSGWFLHIGP